MDLLKDILGFIKHRKKYWLVPAICILFILGILIVLGGGTAIAPFIYTIF